MNKKLLRLLMKVSKFMLYGALLQILFLNLLFAHNSDAQKYSSIKDVEIEVEFHRSDLKEVISKIELLTDFHFTYYTPDFKAVRNFNIHWQKITVADLLLKLSGKYKVAFRQVNNSITIKELSDLSNKGPLEIILEEITVSGQVISSEDREPLVGVNVLERGTLNGTVTDVNGNYTIAVPSEESILAFSSVGYVNTEIRVGAQSTINIELEPDLQALDEIVVIGYGTAKKSDLTGAVSRVDREVLKNKTQLQAFDIIAGRVAGVNINQSANPSGGGAIIEIRGPTSLTGGTSPLIVVDGVIYNGDIRDINPNDIENIDVLKDASSAAVFGSKAASGVIIITTKKGGMSKPIISFSSKLSVSKVNNNDFRPRSGKEYEEFRRDYFRTLGTGLPDFYWSDPNDLPSGVALQQWRDASNNPNADDTQEYLNRMGFFPIEVDQYLAGEEVDWFDQVMGTGLLAENDLSIRGGTEKTSYFWSAGYTHNDGIITGDGSSTFRTRLNLDFEVADWLNVGINTHFSERDLSGVPASLTSMFRVSPYAERFNEDGTLNPTPGGYALAPNPLENTEGQLKERKQNNIFASVYAEVKLPLGIKYRVSYQPRYNFERNYNFWPSETLFGGLSHVNGYGTREESSQFSWLLDNILTWNKEIDRHRIDATFLFNLEKTQNYLSFMSNENFSPNQALGFSGLQFGANPLVNTIDEESSGNALMGRINYVFDNRYFLTASVRRDGYSAFGQENPTAIFPAVAAAWNLSNENFFNVDWISNMKLRVSWGVNGNRDIGIYSSLARVTSNLYYDGTNVQIGVFNNTLENSSLQWERTEALNFGLDLALFENRINLTAEFYSMTTTNLLQARQLPEITGFDEIITNLGELENKGIELTVNSVNISKSEFTWRSGLVFSSNRNKIISLFGDVDESGNLLPDYTNRWFPGQGIDVIWDYDVVGVWQLNEENDAAEYNSIPGDYKAIDIDNSGSYDELIDKQFIGHESPRYRLGLTNDFTYKRFTASIFFRADIGHSGIFTPATHESSTYDRRSIWFIPYWTPTNGNNEFARTSESRSAYGGGLDIYKSKTFLRLQDISLSYNVPLAGTSSFQSLVIFTSARNLLTFTKWPGWDPEGNGSSDFPMPQTFTLGVNFSL